MSRKSVAAIETARFEALRWIDEICDALGTVDREYGLLAIRAVLHALRDRLTLEQSAHFSGHLPLLFGGIYFENWNPNARPTRDRTVGEFAERVRNGLPGIPEREALRIVAVVFGVLQRNLVAGECGHGVQRGAGDFASEWDLGTPCGR
jgi:uncharacterized protein (DUF2267 family)